MLVEDGPIWGVKVFKLRSISSIHMVEGDIGTVVPHSSGRLGKECIGVLSASQLPLASITGILWVGN